MGEYIIEAKDRGYYATGCYVGELIRCKDCKYYEPDLFANPWGVCFHWEWIVNDTGHTVDENGYCYRAERKEE